MQFKNFRIWASPFIKDAYCKCGEELKQVSNGLFGVVMFCPKCENVYELKLIKVPKGKVGMAFLEQARREVKEMDIEMPQKEFHRRPG